MSKIFEAVLIHTLLPEGSARVMHFDLFICLFVCLSVWVRNSKTIALVDFTQEVLYPWLGPHLR